MDPSSPASPDVRIRTDRRQRALRRGARELPAPPREFASILAQLGLMLALFDVYRIENRSFRILVLVAMATLPIHYLAPYRWKKPLFVAISVLGMVLVNGLSTAAGVLGVSAVLLAVAKAPNPLADPRRADRRDGRGPGDDPVAGRPQRRGDRDRRDAGGRDDVHVPDGDLSLRAKARPGPRADRQHAQLLLPPAQLRLPAFPGDRLSGLHRGYFARGVHEIQSAGLIMMWRGTLHLLGYRVIDRLLLISADAVHGPMSLAAYLVCNYLLYLRVSGQFHLACGMLHLFGFQLPETHRHYLLADGFTDYWRRINIYWKDFMVRVVFNPVVFRLKRWPRPAAMAAATAVVFVATWFLHAYQSFWLRGVWSFGVPDALFWGILGVLVLINVQLDARRGARRAGGASRSPLSLAIRAARIVGTFATIALLWSLWSSPSVGAWVDLIRRGLRT